MFKHYFWEITKRCNLSCIHCISTSNYEKDLKTNLILKVVDKIGKWGGVSINFTGGEPLCRKDLITIINACYKKGINTSVLTNGTLMDEVIARKIKGRVFSVGVSLDGAMIESNDRIRGAGTFSRAMRGINHLRNNGIPFSIYFTLNGQNVSDIVKIFPLAEKLGTTGVRINDISFLGSAKKNKRLLVVRNKKYKDIIINYLRRDGRHLNKANGCSVSKDSVFLSPQGRMYPCVHLYQSNAACGLGNIQKFNMALYNTYVSGLERIKDKSCPYTIYNSRRYSWCENKGNTCCLK